MSNEITLIEFAKREGKRRRTSPRTIKNRIKAGRYPSLEIRPINQRVIMVSNYEVYSK